MARAKSFGKEAGHPVVYSEPFSIPGRKVGDITIPATSGAIRVIRDGERYRAVWRVGRHALHLFGHEVTAPEAAAKARVFLGGNR